MHDRSRIHFLFHHFRCYMNGLLRLRGNLDGENTAKSIDPLSQTSHTGLHGVVGNDLFNGAVVDCHLFLCDPHICHGLRNEMLSCDLLLLDWCIPVKLYDFHTVQQWLRNGIRCIRRTNEHNIRKVVRNVHVVICKRVILFRIQHFQKGTGRASVIRCRQFIHFIENHNRIRDTALVDPIHNSSWHGANISSSVSSDIGFIMDAT